jgi:hypothetical protein
MKLFFVFILFILSCAKYSRDELLTAPEQVEINGREYILEPLVYRDYQPFSGRDGPPLYAGIDVIAIDSLPIPSKLDASHIWIINGDEIWDTDLIDRYISYDREYIMQKKAEGSGPHWDTGIYVDVVIEMIYDGSAYLLRADSQVIARID